MARTALLSVYEYVKKAIQTEFLMVGDIDRLLTLFLERREPNLRSGRVTEKDISSTTTPSLHDRMIYMQLFARFSTE